MSIRTRVMVLVSILVTLYAKRYREKTSIAVITALYSPDGRQMGLCPFGAHPQVPVLVVTYQLRVV